MTRLRASVAVHHAAKHGNSASEYEDAWKIVRRSKPDEEIDVRGWRCAVADGASESLLAGRWANELVREFTEEADIADPGVFAETVRRAADHWPAVVSDYVEHRESTANPLRWYEKPGLAKGAHATLLALVVSSGEDGPRRGPVVWKAAALGDTCVFQIRDDHLLSAFPIADSGAFGTSPGLVGSRDPDTVLLARRVASYEGTLMEGDDLYVGTDAFAAWFLTEHERGRHPWHALRDLGVTVDFDEWLAGERDGGRMHNDDVTLVHLNVW